MSRAVVVWQRVRHAYLTRRLLQMIIVLWAIATLLFFMFRLMPGTPLAAYITPTFTPQQQAALLHQFGLDKPLYVQYEIYLVNLVQGRLGESFFYNETVGALIGETIVNTLYLMLSAMIFAYVVGVLGGVLLAWKRGTRTEGIGIVLTLLTRSAPQFWVGMLLLAVFSFHFGWFPASGALSAGVTHMSNLHKLVSPDYWHHMVLPGVTLGIYLLGLPLLLMRSNMLDVLGDDFVTMARMKGLPEWRVVLLHAARNAALPVVTAMTLGIGYAVGGNVVIETVFGWPGLGRLLVHAVSADDYPLAQGAFLVIAAIMIGMNLVADLLYSRLDPRVAKRGAEA